MYQQHIPEPVAGSSGYLPDLMLGMNSYALMPQDMKFVSHASQIDITELRFTITCGDFVDCSSLVKHYCSTLSHDCCTSLAL